MYSLLMGTFDIPSPINYLGSTSVGNYIATVIGRMDPWVLLSHYEPEVPLSAMEVAYEATVNTTIDPILVPPIVSEKLKETYLLAWTENSLHTEDCLDMALSFDEAILEAMSGRDKICEDIHHRSYFLPELSRIENQEFHVRLAGDADIPINPLPREGIFSKENMENISITIPINIFANPNIVENVYIAANFSPEEIAIYTTLFKEFSDMFSWSYEKMPGIDPSIVEHEIRTYPDAKLVR